MRLRHASREEVVFTGAGTRAAFERCRALLWSYRFYPSSLVTTSFAKEKPRVGEVLRQQIRVGPLRFHGPVRVLDVRDEPARAGYRYEAMPGDVERGIASFDLALSGDTVRFCIESDSAPAHWLARLFPFIARAIQRRAVEGAFASMRSAAEGRA